MTEEPEDVGSDRTSRKSAKMNNTGAGIAIGIALGAAIGASRGAKAK